MLPRIFYEALPYCYIVTGFICAMYGQSTLISVSAFLLVMVGLLLLFMRFNFRRDQARRMDSYQTAYEDDTQPERHERSGNDRRTTQYSFPVRDHSGCLVNDDRRRGERRQSYA